MPARSRWLALSALFLLLAPACHSPSQPDGSTIPSAAIGTWLGATTDDRFGTGTFRITLVKAGSGSATHSWQAMFTERGAGGSLVAQPDGNQLQLILACSDGGAAVSTVTVQGNRLTGTYSGTTCSLLGRGSLDLARQ